MLSITALGRSNQRVTDLAERHLTPAPTQASMPSEFGSALDARLIEDGRIAVLVTTSSPQSGDLVLFAGLRRDGDRLLIDEEQVVEVAAAASPEDAATPSA